MEHIVLCVFIVIMLVCIISGHSILYALFAGYLVFCSYALIKKYTIYQLFKMSREGIKTVKNILFIFPLIGMITAVWRACGTIPFIIYYTSGMIVPSVFLLASFLLCCFVSVLTGTSLGTAATVGVICMTLANAMGIDRVFVGGAVLAGAFFGDRCSPMSTSALLVSELTGTDIYRNIKNMIRTSVVPFIVSCFLYLLLGMTQKNSSVPVEIRNVFADNFNLHWIVVLPAVLIIVLCLLRVKVRTAMIVSILAASLICLSAQDIDIISLLKLLTFGFQSPDQQLAVMMDGGGIISMVRVIAIVCVSSSYAGIFDETGLLDEIKKFIFQLSEKITAYGSILITSVIACMVACNQTLGIMLTHNLCKDTVHDKEQMAVNLENTVVVIAALIPWTIACAAPLTALAAPNSCIFAAFYLYLLSAWNLFFQSKPR